MKKGILLAIWPAMGMAANAQLEDRLQQIYGERQFEVAEIDPAAFQWLPDSTGVMLLERSPGNDGVELAQYESRTGKRTVVLTAAQLMPAGASKPLQIDAYSFSTDGRMVLLQTNSRRGGGVHWVGDLWALDRTSGALRRLASDIEALPVFRTSRIALSRGNDRILFSQGGNLYAYDVRVGLRAALTQDGSADVINHGARWNSNGLQIAYAQVDVRPEGQFAMLNNTDTVYPQVRYKRYAKAGTAVAIERVGVMEARGGATRWISIPDPTKMCGGMEWEWVGVDELSLQCINRSQNERDIYLANTVSGDVRRIYREYDPAWVTTESQLRWIDRSRALVKLDEKDGWQHAYRVARDGSYKLLTPGAFDIAEITEVDERRGWLYYIASPQDATRRYLFRTRLSGVGRAEKVTPAEFRGTNQYAFSPDARWAIHTYSAIATPPVIQLVEIPSHRVVHVFESNAPLRAKLQALNSNPPEIFTIRIGGIESNVETTTDRSYGGAALDAWIFKPRDFDATKKYPVLVYIYGEPQATTVRDRWYQGWQQAAMFHRAMADAGYLVVSIDNRGTPSLKGRDWRRWEFLEVGERSMQDQAAAMYELARQRPYVDISRVGVWGLSGGGSNTLNAMFRHPDVYKVGVALAAKTVPDLYWWRWQERYMRTPQANPDGYRTSSPMNFAEGLRGNLLIVHGSGDSNCHLQGVELLVNRLVALGKPFDYMVYPNREHGLEEGEGTALHLHQLMARYFLEHLPAGPADRDTP